MDFLPENVRNWLPTMFVALIGRLAAHAVAVQAGKRKPLGWALCWDIPIAIFLGYVAAGLAEWVGVSGDVQLGIVAAISYMGPHGVDAMLARMMEKRP